MNTRHTVPTTIPVRFRHSGLAAGEFETAYPTVEIAFSYNAGALAILDPDRGWDPGYGPEIDLIAATIVDGADLPFDLLSQAEVREWVTSWLDGDGYSFACTWAERDRALAEEAAS